MVYFVVYCMLMWYCGMCCGMVYGIPGGIYLIVSCGLARYYTVYYVVWYGPVWYYVIRYGMVLCGAVWYVAGSSSVHLS